MAKEQNLSLNPTKISGICGRLLCCLKYESDMYCGKCCKKREKKKEQNLVPPAGDESGDPQRGGDGHDHQPPGTDGDGGTVPREPGGGLLG